MSKQIKRIGNIAINRAGKEHQLHNLRYEFDDAHTHIRSFAMAEIIAKNVTGKRRPKTHDHYLLESHIRLSDDPKYIRLINELIEARVHNPKEKYKRPVQKRTRRR